MRTPFAVMAVIGAALLGLSALGGAGGEPGASPARGSAPAPAVAPVAVIARRVAAIRGLRFDRVPSPVSVTPEQARREGLEDLDRSYPAAKRRADEEILKLLGLVEPDVSLREVSADTFSEGVAGYYDPRTKRLRTVQGAATGSRVLAEMILAHELNHALEDQRFSLDLEVSGGSDDRALARLALAEGTASALMYRYVDEHFSREEALAGALGGAFADTASLPPFLEAQLVWPYIGGQRFVEALLSRASGRWDLVDLAQRTRPPASTEQVMHPEKYLRVETPVRVRLRASTLLGRRGYERVRAGTSGELQTREILATAGGGGSADAAAGWGGDRYELWQKTAGAAGCPAAPCRAASVLVLRWAWDTPSDEREFAAKLRQWVENGLGARPAGEGTWTLDGSGVAVARRGGEVTLALAPRTALARRLAATR